MRKKWMRFPVFIACAALAFVLAFQTAEPAYAAVDITPTPAGLEVTGYSISPATGAIRTGNEIGPVTVTLFDTRVTSDPSNIVVSLSTPSFTNQGTISALGTAAATSAGFSYTVTFSKLRYTGTGNTLSFNIAYDGLTPPVPIGNVNMTIGRCVPWTEPTTPDFVATGFVLTSANFGDDVVYAGDQFVLSATILTTNGTLPVENVSVTFTPPEQLTLSGGSSVVYVGTMAPNTSRSVSVALMASANIPEGSYSVSIDVSGINEGNPVSAHMTVSIPILQPERFEIFDVMLPSDLTAGFDDGMGFSTVTLVNKGKGAVANVTVEIVGEGLYTDVGRQYLGNVAGGEQKIADFIMYADIPGQINAYVVVWYENVRGEQMSLERPFTVNVNEPWFEDPADWDPGFPMPEEPVSTGPPTWFWIIVGAAAAAVVAILLVRRNKKKKAAAEAALDYEDDDD